MNGDCIESICSSQSSLWYMVDVLAGIGKSLALIYGWYSCPQKVYIMKKCNLFNDDWNIDHRWWSKIGRQKCALLRRANIKKINLIFVFQVWCRPRLCVRYVLICPASLQQQQQQQCRDTPRRIVGTHDVLWNGDWRYDNRSFVNVDCDSKSRHVGCGTIHFVHTLTTKCTTSKCRLLTGQLLCKF